jgi:hypothetical protein
MGKLTIWGDVVNFNMTGTPNQCITQSRFKRGERVGFRMTAVDAAQANSRTRPSSWRTSQSGA